MDIHDFPPMPEFKNYGAMIEDIDTNVKGLETVLNEMLKTMQSQSKLIQDVIEVNQELQNKINSYNPINN